MVLQTARANVFGVNREKRATARMLFDNGSQKKCITEELKNKLQLTDGSTQEIN